MKKRREMTTTRRSALKFLSNIICAIFCIPCLNFGTSYILSDFEKKYSLQTIRLLEDSLVIDMLSMLILNRELEKKWLENPDSFTIAEWKRFRSSGINVFHISHDNGNKFSKDDLLQFFASYNGFIANHDQFFMRIDSIEDLNRVKRSGKIGLMLGFQNSEHFEKVDDVNLFFGLGQRVSQLTYNERNLIGNGSTERADGGLSDFGVSIVERMNKVGMAIDVAHCGDRTTLDACELSSKPVLITHSACRSLVPGHPRCKTDEAIKKMAVTGGVMGIPGLRMFIRDREPTTIDHYFAHIDHIAQLVGVEHVGIGSDIDLDGYDDMPLKQQDALRKSYKESYGFRDKIDIEGLGHPKRMFDIAEGLSKRGYSNSDIKGILGGNVKRALTEIWSI